MSNGQQQEEPIIGTEGIGGGAGVGGAGGAGGGLAGTPTPAFADPVNVEPARVAFERSDRPGFIKVRGKDVPRASIDKWAAQGVDWAIQAKRMVPAEEPDARPEASPEALGARARPTVRRPRVRPAGFRPTTRTTTMSGGITPGAAEAIGRIYGEGGSWEEETKAIQTAGEYQALMMDQASKLAAKKEQIVEERSLAQKDLAQRRKSATDAWMAKYQQTLQETNAMKMDDFWADKSTGTKILAGIGLALGGMAQGIRGGGPNTALDIINAEIQRDLEVQKANLRKGRARLEDMRGGYALIRQQYDDEELADRIYWAGAEGQVQSKIDTLLLNAKTDGMVNSLQTLKAARRKQADQNLLDIMLRGEIDVKTTEKYLTPKTTGTGEGAKYDEKLWVPTFGGNARGPEQFKKLTEWTAAISELDEMYAKQIEYRDNWANYTDAQKRAKVQEINKMATKKNANIEGAGAALSQSEIDMVGVTDTEKMGSLLATSRLEARREMIRNAYRHKADHLIRKVDPSTVPQDELELMYRLQGQRTGAEGEERSFGGD